MSKHKYSKSFLERTGLKNPKEEKEAVTEEVTEQPEQMQQRTDFPQNALGMYPFHDKETGGTRYALVSIPYDPETGDVGFVKEICRDVREDAIDRFKVEVDKQGFFTGEKRND